LASSSTLDGYTSTTDFTRLTALAKTEFLTSNGLKSFQDATGFQQLRYFCHKASIGKTIHVKTAMNAKGFEAVRYEF